MGHVLSTLLITAHVCLGGVAFAFRLGTSSNTATRLSLVSFGAWIAVAALREMCLGIRGSAHHHRHSCSDPGVDETTPSMD
jgi:hypothetical protein